MKTPIKSALTLSLLAMATSAAHAALWSDTSIGYRTGTPKVKFDKGFNSKSVTAILKEQFPDYVRTVDEMDKEKLIASRDTDGFDAICQKGHIAIVQDETFYVESKSEELQPA